MSQAKCPVVRYTDCIPLGLHSNQMKKRNKNYKMCGTAKIYFNDNEGKSYSLNSINITHFEVGLIIAKNTAKITCTLKKKVKSVKWLCDVM